MTKAKKLAQRGFTLIELMIVVVIIGILASLAIYGVQRYVANAKSAEARTMLGRISKDVLVSFEGESQDARIVELGESADISRNLCTTVEASVPTTIAPVSAKKYQPKPSEWQTNNWQCIGTSVTTPIYYMYNYTSTTGSQQAADDAFAADGTVLAVQAGPAADGDHFEATAEGDLDGDGILSKFTMPGKVVAETNATSGATVDLALVLATTIIESNAAE